MPKPIHPRSRYDGRQFAPSDNSFTDEEVSDPLAILAKLAPVVLSPDPEDRREAQRLAYLLTRAIYCPDGVWVVETAYAANAQGKRWSDRIVIWTAHLTKEEAERWHAFWTEHWAKKRNGYEMLPIRQADRVPLMYLVHPDAPVGEGATS